MFPREHPDRVCPRFPAQPLPLLFPPSIQQHPLASSPHLPTPSLINIAGKNKTKQSKYLIRSREPQRALPPSVSSSSRSQQLLGPNEPECNRDRWQRQPLQRGQVCHIPCTALELRLGPLHPPALPALLVPLRVPRFSSPLSPLSFPVPGRDEGSAPLSQAHGT